MFHSIGLMLAVILIVGNIKLAIKYFELAKHSIGLKDSLRNLVTAASCTIMSGIIFHISFYKIFLKLGVILY